MKYRPDIDGLRAIAVLPVIFFHAGFDWISGGFIGVDVFFVISGFLITSIIYEEITAGSFTFANFYERRARRILPPLYFTLLVTLPLSWFLLIPDAFIAYAESLIGVIFFSSNLVFWSQLNYFSPAAETIPLLHTWSLAIEEQYYIFFPFILLLLRQRSHKPILIILCSLLVLSFGICVFGAIFKPSANYYLLPSRFWELLIGSIAAIFLKHDIIKRELTTKASVLSFTGLIIILLSNFLITEELAYPSWYTLIPTVATVLVLAFTLPGMLTYKLLSTKLLVVIGLISYSAYLWHQPIFVYLNLAFPEEKSQLVVLSAIAATLLLAYFSWKYIEAPFRNKQRTSKKSIILASTLASLFLVSCGITIIKNHGFETRFTIDKRLVGKFELPMTSNGWCFYSVDSDPALSVGSDATNCFLGSETGKGAILFGDSYAGMYEPLWHKLGQELNLRINSVTTNWCHTSITDFYYWERETRAKEQCMLNRSYFRESIANNTFDTIIVSSAWAMVPTDKFEKELMFLKKASTNFKIIIMPLPTAVNYSSLMDSVYRSKPTLFIEQEKYSKAKSINEALGKFADENDNVFFISAEALFGGNDTAPELYTEDKLPYSLDGGHISIYGSEKTYTHFSENYYYESLKNFLI